MHPLAQAVAIFLGIVTTSAFVGTAIYWFWLAATDHEVANRGGFLFALAPLALAAASFLIFRAVVHGLNKK